MVVVDGVVVEPEVEPEVDDVLLLVVVVVVEEDDEGVVVVVVLPEFVFVPLVVVVVVVELFVLGDTGVTVAFALVVPLTVTPLL